MKEIKDCPGYFITKTGSIISTKKGKLFELANQEDKDGYQYIVILNKDKKRVRYAIHRLIAIYYIPNPNNLPCVCHHDDNPRNNSIPNLFWGTNKDNMADKVMKNRQAKGETFVKSKLTNKQVQTVKQYNDPRLDNYFSTLYKVVPKTIRDIRTGRTWKHI